MNYAEIKKELRKPIPANLISSRPSYSKGEQVGTIEFVNVTDYKELLDERAGVWTAQVNEFKQVGNSLCLILRLSIHADDGVFSQDGTGIEPIDTDSYGDPFSNAYSQGLRRACESHGLSRELWKKDSNQSTREGSGQSSFANQKPENIENPIAATAVDLVTAKQLGMIRALGRTVNVLPDEECFDLFKCKTDELSRKAASSFIGHLQELEKSPGKTTEQRAVAPVAAAYTKTDDDIPF